MRARFILYLWLLALLFPLARLRRFSLTYRHAFDTIFAPEWMHVTMHAALYAGLAILLARALRLSPSHKTTLIVILSILVVGALQESLQLASHGSLPIGEPSIRYAVYDLGVDLVGGLFGLAGLNLLTTRRYLPAY